MVRARAEAFAKAMEIPSVYTDYREMLAQDLPNVYLDLASYIPADQIKEKFGQESLQRALGMFHKVEHRTGPPGAAPDQYGK